MMSAGALVRAGARRLEAAGATAEEALVDAGVLMRGLQGWSLADWLLQRDQPVAEPTPTLFEALLTRRAAGEPVAYLLGTREFYGRVFHVAPGVLIPRPETEHLVQEAIGWLNDRHGAQVVDVGTGSGCIAITLALESPHVIVTATDVSEAALDIARGNEAALGARVAWHHADLFGGAAGPFDLIVSNPPYVPERDRDSLRRDVREYEPAGALYGGPDGLAVIRRLIPEALAHLTPGGRLMMEVGAGQRADITALLEQHGLSEVRWVQDLQGIDRVVSAARAL